MTIKVKEPETTIEPLKESSIDSELEFLKYMGTVKSRLSKQITDDFVLAKLDEQDKKGIIEMTQNAYHIQRLIEVARAKATTWTFNTEQDQWELKWLPTKQDQQMEILAQNSFDNYMTKVLMTVILNRNRSDNDLAKLLIKRDKTSEDDKITEALEKLREEQIKNDKEKE